MKYLELNGKEQQEDVLTQVRAWRGLDARAIRIRDISGTPEMHEAVILLMRAVCAEAGMPVYGSGHIRRLEDIKKMLYAGCTAVLCDMEDDTERRVREEAVSRFGEDRVPAEEPAFPVPVSVGWESCRPDAAGLVPCIVQDEVTGEVLMMAYMNEESFEQTVRTGRMTYWSRSRREIWVKGLTSGHYQFVRSMALDCDGDTLLARVRQIGAACHTGNRSCFFTEMFRLGHGASDPQQVLRDVYATILERRAHPKEGSYTNYLFDSGLNKILKKVGEEAAETIIAAKDPDPVESVYEIADLQYHLMVLMAEKGLTWDDIAGELASRE